jgi:hypothetical protein
MSELDRIRERLRQNRAADRRSSYVDARQPASAEARIGAQHLPGDRVFDRVTGQEGTVIGGTSENVIVPTPK